LLSKNTPDFENIFRWDGEGGLRLKGAEKNLLLHSKISSAAEAAMPMTVVMARRPKAKALGRQSRPFKTTTFRSLLTPMITGPLYFPLRGVDWRHEESIGFHRSAGGGVRRCVGCEFGTGR
jgi:hypothetical protein